MPEQKDYKKNAIAMYILLYHCPDELNKTSRQMIPISYNYK